jgi:hypothetical protein
VKSYTFDVGSQLNNFVVDYDYFTAASYKDKTFRILTGWDVVGNNLTFD